jgi:flagellar biosynthesis/type III secretory pathway protein FliH
MRESPIVAQWKAEGLAEGRAEGLAEGRAEGLAEARVESLLKILRFRFPGEAGADLIASIEAELDLNKLSNAMDSVFQVASLEEFRAASGF